MNTNYDALFRAEAEKARQKHVKLLLHACCAPCSTYCLTQVLDAFDVTLYYANDNITAAEEYEKRLGELKKLVKIVNDGNFEIKPRFPLKLVVQPYDPARFFAAAQGLEGEKEGGARCTKCFEMRLSDAANYAAQHGFETFGTTLTVSPYKNARLLNAIGAGLERENLHWLPGDFKKRDGYNTSVRLSQKYGLYRQHYCGCVFSDWQSAELGVTRN